MVLDITPSYTTFIIQGIALLVIALVILGIILLIKFWTKNNK